MNDGSGLKYLLTDHLGSVVAVTDDEGNLISQQRYLPFGGIRNDINDITQTDYGYTGQRNLDTNIGLMDYKARFYSPLLNRFIQPDSIVPDPSNPQAWNRYSYVVNSPINLADPSGHCYINGYSIWIPNDQDGSCSWSLNSNGKKEDNSEASGDGGKIIEPKDYNIDILEILEILLTTGTEELTISITLGNTDCDLSCQELANILGLGATAVDTFAAGANIVSAVIVDVAILINPVIGGQLLLAWRAVSPLFNAIATMGTFAWAAQGFLTGDNMISTTMTFNTDSSTLLDSINISGRISQDTIVSATIDGLGWLAPEPNSAAGVSFAGVAYDFMRNPAPLFLPYDPLIPSIFNISFNNTFKIP